MIINALVVNTVIFIQFQMEMFVSVQMIDIGMQKMLIVVIIFDDKIF